MGAFKMHAIQHVVVGFPNVTRTARTFRNFTARSPR